MRKTVFIIPYFGEFNNYFQIFLNSCKMNSDFDWLIFTDDYGEYDYPDNVKVEYLEFEDIKKLFQNKFEFEISLEYPYKLCDYKVSYGYVFSEYIKNYKSWGHCDTDLIWGDISKFISDEDIDNYDKIGILGHCTVYKNNELVNTMFMKPINGIEVYRRVFTTERNCSFDEEFNNSINNIFEFYQLKVRQEEFEANIYTKSSNFKITRMDFGSKKYLVEKKKESIFVWDNGNLYRYIIENNNLIKKEYMYIHMQSRRMKVKLKDMNSKIYKIIPNCFDELEMRVDILGVNEFKNIRKKYFNLHYFKLRSKNLYKKIIRRLTKL